MKIKYLYYILGAVGAALIFIGISQVSQSYSHELQLFTEHAGALGVLSYIGVMILSIVVAPIGTGFLLPIAANSWGPMLAAVYSIAGWTIGSMIAFWLSRKYGLKLVKNIKTVNKLRTIEQAIPRHHVFLSVVLLRMSLPVDLLSYALGIFSTMSYQMFFWSTVLGISPFAFIMMYAATSSVMVQVIVAVAGSLIFLAGLYYLYKQSKKELNNKVEK